jgi:hypothetical protein
MKDGVFIEYTIKIKNNIYLTTFYTVTLLVEDLCRFRKVNGKSISEKIQRTTQWTVPLFCLGQNKSTEMNLLRDFFKKRGPSTAILIFQV